MRSQNVYRTNADYLNTFKKLEKLRETGLIEKVRESHKGHIIFKFKNCDVRPELSNKGTLVIYWHSEEEKEKFYPLLPEVLATSDGSPITIDPLASTVYNIPYETKMFTLAWCKEKVKFSRVVSGFFDWWERRAERKFLEKKYRDERLDGSIRELECKRAIRHEIFEIYEQLPFEKRNEELPVELQEKIRQKWRERYRLA